MAPPPHRSFCRMGEPHPLAPSLCRMGVPHPWSPRAHSAGWGATPPGPLPLPDGGATPLAPRAHSAGWGSHTPWPPRAHSAGWGSHTHWPPHRSSACWVYRTPDQIHIFNTANSCHVQQKCTRKPTENADTRRNSAQKRSELESVRCRVPSWVRGPEGAGGATL